MIDKPIKFLTEKEVALLRKGARKTRNPIRNELMILMLYRHGLRETELCRLTMNQVDLEEARLHITRIKGGNNFSHPIEGEELRMIRRYIRSKATKNGSHPWLFISEQGNQLARGTVIAAVKACAAEGGITKSVSPHMLRHGCGYYLANKGYDLRVIQDYLGHRQVQNTVIYTKLSGKQFEGMW